MEIGCNFLVLKQRHLFPIFYFQYIYMCNNDPLFVQYMSTYTCYCNYFVKLYTVEQCFCNMHAISFIMGSQCFVVVSVEYVNCQYIQKYSICKLLLKILQGFFLKTICNKLNSELGHNEFQVVLFFMNLAIYSTCQETVCSWMQVQVKLFIKRTGKQIQKVMQNHKQQQARDQELGK